MGVTSGIVMVIMSGKVDYSSPLIPCELDVFLKHEQGMSLNEIAQSRNITFSSVTTLLHRAAKKLGIRKSQIHGCLAFLSERQLAKLKPLDKPVTDSFGNDAAPWPPKFCPCCSQKWPVTEELLFG